MAEYTSLFTDEAEEVPASQNDGYTSLFTDEAEPVSQKRQDVEESAAERPAEDGYGFTERQRDQIAAEGGRKAYRRYHALQGGPGL